MQLGKFSHKSQLLERAFNTMIQASLVSWLFMLAIMLLASVSGYMLSRLIPWTPAARRAGVDKFAGFSLAPFMLGAFSLIALTFLPGYSTNVHLFIVISGVILVFGLSVWLASPQESVAYKSVTKPLGWHILISLSILYLLAILYNSIFLPLTQNDPLEYFLVARSTFETRDLTNYPSVNSKLNSSGFFATWTHPPLYVALGYLTKIIQGDAELMRLISPWFLLCNALIVYSLGSLINRYTGLFSLLIFISTPLYFLGASYSSIDSLPTLGLTLIAVSTLCIESSLKTRGILIGLALAFSLYTHSQAILFIPIAFALVILQAGLVRMYSNLTEILIVACTAILLAIWPYLRNYWLFGSAVSDSPAVFADPYLDWNSYFKYSRNLSTLGNMIKYGVFKGWFSFKSFGFTYWIMITGLILVIRHVNQVSWRSLVFFGSRATFDLGKRILWLSSAIIGIYLLMILASVLLGMNLLVKNDRYILVILPFVSLVGGYGLQALSNQIISILSSKNQPLYKRDLSLGAYFFVALGFLIQFLILSVFYNYHMGTKPLIEFMTNVRELSDNSNPKSLTQRQLEIFPSFRAIFWMRENLPKDALILSLRPADMYYSGRRMVSYLDSKMLAVYSSTSTLNTLEALRKIGVTHIYIPDYSLPVFYNSALSKIIGDPSLTRMIFNDAGTKVFSLLSQSDKEPNISVADTQDFSPINNKWCASTYLFSRSARLQTKQLPENGFSEFEVALLSGFYSKLLESESCLESSRKVLHVKAGEEYRAAFHFAGKGFIRIFVTQYTADGIAIPPRNELPASYRLDEFVLKNPDELRVITERFVTFSNASYVNFAIEQTEDSIIQIHKATLDRLISKKVLP